MNLFHLYKHAIETARAKKAGNRIRRMRIAGRIIVFILFILFILLSSAVPHAAALNIDFARVCV